MSLYSLITTLFTRTSRGRRVPRLLVLLAAITLTSACTGNGESGRDMPELLRFTVLPGASESLLRERHTPLLEHVAQKLGVKYVLTIPDSYSEALELFNKNEVDIAYFGGFTFIKAHEESGAVPLVIRDIDSRFTSYLITSRDLYRQFRESNRDIAFFKDKSLCFGSRLSTSGHLMPRYFMSEMNITPETYFSKLIHTGAHDKTAYMVRDGQCDLGAVNSQTFNNMIDSGQLNNDEVIIFWESPPYPDYVWSIQQSFKPAVRKSIRDVFLALSPSCEEDNKLLGDSGGFLPVSVQDFYQLKQIAASGNMMEISTDF